MSSVPADPVASPPPRPDVRLDTSLESLLVRLVPAAHGRVLATLVDTAGSTYRKPGARMLIAPGGALHGLLSGGCLEQDLREHAAAVASSGTPVAVEYDLRSPDDLVFGIGAGCEGAMRILLEPLPPDGTAAGALAQAAAEARTGRPACLVTVHEGPATALGTHAPLTAPPELAAAARLCLAERRTLKVDEAAAKGRVRALVQYLAPAPRLLVCGAGPDAEPVVTGALELGWSVTVVDHRAAYADPRRFPGADVRLADARALREAVPVPLHHAAVVMSHHLPSDAAYLRELAAEPRPAYVGLLGPAARRRRLAAEVGAAMAGLRTRLRGPVGLDIGAATPAGIALAILAEIHAWLAGHDPGPGK